MFHLLRRQVKMKTRVPLIVFTPKSLLRHPMVQSKIEDLAKGKFMPVIDDQMVDPKKVKKLFLPRADCIMILKNTRLKMELQRLL